MHSYFAAAMRDPLDKIQQDHFLIARNPVVKEMLSTAGGMAAVLNEHRQVLHLNQRLMKRLGIQGPNTGLGLRPGEILECVHAREEPGGCGTSKSCKDCGAVIAILSCQAKNKSVEQDCVIFTETDGEAGLLHLHVRVVPINLHARQFLLVFLEDKSAAPHPRAL